MQLNFFRFWRVPVTGLTLLACVFSAQAATGARIVVQAWDPLNPTVSNNTTLVNEPTLVSDVLQDVWTELRPEICDQLKSKMGLGGAAAGETLRDIECILDKAITLQVTRAGQNALRAQLALSGYVEATSTTPDIYAGIGLGAYADPRFSVALTAKLDLHLTIQPDRNQTLRVTKAKFTLNNATLDSHNAPADLIDFVVGELVPFFGGPNYKTLAEGAINAVSEELAGDFNDGLAPVNALLKGPSELVRVGASGANNFISVAFAARAIEPPTNGSVTGLVRWDPAKFSPRNGCQSFEVRAVVQTGPVPLYAYDQTPPRRTLGNYQAEQTGAATCAFTLSGIAEDWPNVLTSRVTDPPIVKNSATSRDRETYSMVKDGWDGVAVPRPTLDARNYKVYANTLKMGHQTTLAADDRTFLEREYRTNPKFVPERVAGAVTQPGSIEVPATRMSPRVSPQVEAVRLNPQPLPPDPEPNPVAPTHATDAIAEPAGDPAAIIIVGGKPAYERVKPTTSAKAVEKPAVQP